MRKEYGIHNAVIFSYKKEWNPDIFRKMVGTRGHYVKWNKPDPERQLLHVPSCVWKLKEINLNLEQFLLEAGNGWEGVVTEEKHWFHCSVARGWGDYGSHLCKRRTDRL